MNCLRTLILVILFGAVGLEANAAARFSLVFSDHIVLQRDQPIKVRGFDANGKIEVELGETKVTAAVKSDGQWEAMFPKSKANTKGQTLKLYEDEKLVATLRDVLIGDVWVAAGQSNMQMKVNGMVKGLPEAKNWVNSANNPIVRIRRVNDPVLEKKAAEASDFSIPGEWIPMTPESVGDFSAVAAVFAEKVSRELKVPIGMIDVSWGGKPIEPFIPGEAFQGDLLEEIVKLSDQQALDQLAKMRGGVIIRNPQGYPGAIFNARMAPLTSFGICGFIWYQGESNAGNGEDPREYREKMEALASGWRQRWGNSELPIYFVQLPGFEKTPGWIRMREEQRRSLSIENSGMVVTMDVRGEGIHPPDKISVGERLAGLAIAGAVDKEQVASGPLYRSHQVEGGTVIVEFEDVGSGLMAGEKPGVGPAEENKTADLKWFELAGEDRKWFAAKAVIEGNRVIVSSPDVPKPLEVRYACKTIARGANLYNREGLPASPFCSNLEWLPWDQSIPQPKKE